MSAPSPETSMQTPQREFAVQNYNKKMTYANLYAIFCFFSSLQLVSNSYVTRGQIPSLVRFLLHVTA